MADITQSVKNLEDVLQKMGYTMPGHTSGQPDESFLRAFQKARQDLIVINGQKPDTTYTPAIGQLILKDAQENVDMRIAGLEAYAKGESFTVPFRWRAVLETAHLANQLTEFKVTNTPADIQAGLQAKRFPQDLQKPANIPGVVQFFSGAEGYVRDIDAVSSEINANPTLKALAQKALAPASGGGSPGGGPGTGTPSPPSPPAGAGSPAGAPASVPLAPGPTGGAPAAGAAAPDPAAEAREREARERAQQQAAAEQQQAVEAQRLRAVEATKILQQSVGMSGAEVTGIFDAATKQKVTDYIKKGQEALTTKGTWKGATDGQYSPDLHKVMNNDMDYSIFAGAVERYETVTQVSINGPVQTAAPAPAPAPGGQGGGQQGGAAASAANETPGEPPTEQQLRMYSNTVEQFLVELGPIVNARLNGPKSNMLASLLFETSEIPVITKADGDFGPDSLKALQGTLKALQKQLELTDDEIYNYTPKVGEKIIRAYPKLERSMTDAQKAQLGINKMRLVVGALDGLYDGHKLGDGEKLYDDNPFRLSAMGQSVLGWIFEFIGRIFPGAKPLMDNLVKSFTGGYGYNDLMPADKRDQGLDAAARSVAHLPPEQQLAELYKRALADADANGKTPAELKQALMTGVEALVTIPIGNQASRDAFKAAVDKAFDQAAATPGSSQQTAGAEAAAAFAQTFRQSWAPASASQVDPNTGRPRTEPHVRPTTDPTIKDFMIMGPIERYNIDDIISTFNKADKMAQRYDTAYPMIFKMPDGSLQAMGVAPGNTLTLKPLSTADVAILDKAIVDIQAAQTPEAKAEILTKLRQSGPAFDMLIGGYPDYSLQRLRTEITNAVQFGDLKRRIDAQSSNFDTIDAENRTSTPQQGGRRSAGGSNEGREQWGDQTTTADGEFGAAYQVVHDKIRMREAAMRGPFLIQADAAERGRVMILYCDDFNGLRAERDRVGNLNRALAEGDRFFKTIDITDEFRRFRAGYEEFCASNKDWLRGKGERERFDAYRYEFETKGGKSFAKEYPQMASIIFNPDMQVGGRNYSALMKSDGTPDVLRYAREISNRLRTVDTTKILGRPGIIPMSGEYDHPDFSQPKERKGFLRGLFGRKHDNEDAPTEQQQGDSGRGRNKDEIPPAPPGPEPVGNGAAAGRARPVNGNDIPPAPTGAPDDPTFQGTVPAAVEATKAVTIENVRAVGSDMSVRTGAESSAEVLNPAVIIKAAEEAPAAAPKTQTSRVSPP